MRSPARTRSASVSDAVRGRAPHRSLRKLDLRALAPEVRGPVAAARDVARNLGSPLFLVGGAVRDLHLRRPVADVDLVVPLDAAGFARRLAATIGGRAKFHGRFGTATVELPGGARIDVATSRREEYEAPGALPRIGPGSVADDLARRDFTVNAMALEIAPAKAPVLLDPFGGREDLRRGRIRALHPRSFLDDPTRAFRAVRYANRLGFRIDPATRARIRKAASGGALQTISADRLRREIALLLSEPGRAAAVRELSRLGLARAVHPALGSDAKTLRRLRAAELLAGESAPEPSWLVYLLAWMGDASEPAALSIAARLNLPREARDRVTAWPAAREKLLRASRGRPAGLAEAVSRLDPDTLLAAAATAPPSAKSAILAARSAPGPLLTIGGADLVAAGIPPGPAIGRALASTLAARRKGAIAAEGELAYALKAARR